MGEQCAFSVSATICLRSITTKWEKTKYSLDLSSESMVIPSSIVSIAKLSARPDTLSHTDTHVTSHATTCGHAIHVQLHNLHRHQPHQLT